MLIKEYRITLPLTVEEYQRGQLYSTCEASKNETGGGDGIEIVKNETFDNFPLLGKYKSGRFTQKVYYLETKSPKLLKLLAPKGSLEAHEDCWYAFPYTRTIVSNPKWLKEKFSMRVDSLHLEGPGDRENVHELSEELLKLREVVYIDIAHDPISQGDYRASEDPQLFKSQKTGKGPLVSSNWKYEVKPVMTCYKLVTCEFNMFGLQTIMESYIQKSERRIFTNFARQVFCWIDRWIDMSIEELREIEEKLKDELERQRKLGPIRGTIPDDVEQ